MELTELIRSRRTIHNFRPDPVADEAVEEALRLSLWAPNHRTTWPWVYIWVGPIARAKMIDLAIELKSRKSEMTDAKRLALTAALAQPAHLICLGIKRSESKEQTHEDYATLACSVQIAALALWAKGIGSKWSTGGFTNNEKTYKILGLDAQQVSLEGALLIGIPGILPDPIVRPSLDNFLNKTT